MNQIRLVADEKGRGRCMLNGQRVDGLTRVQVDVSVERPTQVTLTLFAKVSMDVKTKRAQKVVRK